MGFGVSGEVVIGVLPPPPAVALTNPHNGSAFLAGSSVTLGASASSGLGAIGKVEFFAGTTKLGESLTAPFSLVWSSGSSGAYSLMAVATDSLGLRGPSAVVNVAFTTGQTSDLTLVSTGALWKYFDKGRCWPRRP